MPSTDHGTRTGSGGEAGKDVEVLASSDPGVTLTAARRAGAQNGALSAGRGRSTSVHTSS
jgi:hypothetical protein